MRVRDRGGQFAVSHEQGRGGLGRVLVADDRVLERAVAIKELIEPGPDTAARLERDHCYAGVYRCGRASMCDRRLPSA